MPDFPKPLEPAPRCRDCQVALEPGFTLDIGSLVRVSRWVPGTPQPSWLSGEASRAQMDAALQSLTYRCPKCFRLESFAPPKPH